MKKILLGFIAIGLFTFIGCEKDDVTEIPLNSCDVDLSLISNGAWISSSDGHADLTFDGDGKYYENSIYEGDWENTNDCDSIYINRPEGFGSYCVVVSVSSSKLVILTSVGIELEFTRSDTVIETYTDSTNNEITPDTTDNTFDLDGNKYKSVIIGEQEWMSENLRTTKYSDGTTIPNVKEKDQWDNLTSGAWAHYDNDSQHEANRGKLYNWFAVETGKLCPTGWHVPTDAEWTVLTDYLAANGHNGKEAIALRSAEVWAEELRGTDDYGWNGIPGGFIGSSGVSLGIDAYGFWWSASEYNTINAWSRNLGYHIDDVDRDNYLKGTGLSVRCIKD